MSNRVMNIETLSRPARREDLFTLLDQLHINHKTVEHPPVFTVEESRSIKASMAGGHSKNLFVKDKRGDLFLLIAWAEARVDLKGLSKALSAKGRLSFVKPEVMTEILGVRPGAVTPFALVNDRPQRVSRVLFDEALFRLNPVWFHPLENTASTAIDPKDLPRWAAATGHPHQIINLAAPLNTAKGEDTP
ncbi:MAG: prolyl-tRNA synthetase associated domain-containing protein [bacterium]